MKKISLIVIVFILGGTVLTSELSERDLFRKELDIINGNIFIFIFLITAFLTIIPRYWHRTVPVGAGRSQCRGMILRNNVYFNF